MPRARSIQTATGPGILILLIPPVINPASAAHISNFIPVGMLALLSSLRQDGIRAEIYQPHIIIASDDDFIEVARDILLNDPFAVGFSTWCDSFPYSLLIAEAIRQINPSVPIIFGGPQASILGKESLQLFPYIDYILQGEADRTLPQLMKELLNGDGGGTVPGLIYRDKRNNKILHSSPDIIRDLDSLPVPVYESILPEEMVRIDAGRGCPYRCTFCSTNQFFSKKYRVKSVDRLLEEFKYCEDTLGVRWIGISHDMFTLNREFISEFSNRLIEVNKKRKKPYYWTCSARVDCVTESLLDLMYKSGCRAVFFGMETGSPRIQKEIQKNLDVGKASRIIRHCAKLGIYTVVSYMLGFPAENREDLNLTLRSMVQETSHGAYTQLTLLSVLPGTILHREHLEELSYDGSHSGFSDIYPTGRIESMIRDHPDIFSSFYYLRNTEIRRETLLFISALGNYLESFIPTLSLLRDYLSHDLPSMDLCDYIEDKIPEYLETKEYPLPELYFLTDSLKKYLEELIERDLPLYAWDVFHFDFTKAFMIAKYKRWQQLNVVLKTETGRSAGIRPGDTLTRRPYWNIMESGHYIYDFVMEPVRRRDRARFRKGSYYYLVLPVSHRLANIYKIPAKEVPVFMIDEKTTVGEIITKNEGILSEDRILHIIRRMIRLGLVDINQEE